MAKRTERARGWREPARREFVGRADVREYANAVDPERLVVRTEDGRTFVERLLRGSKPGLWPLESHAAPPVKDVRIVWASPIRYIKKGGP